MIIPEEMYYTKGITYRQLACLVAMQGLCANSDYTHSDLKEMSGACIRIADALILAEEESR